MRLFTRAVGLSAPLIMFIIFAGDGLWSDFFPDEVMNIYGYWHESWSTLLKWNLLFFEDHYRPLGAFFYRPLFDLFGFNPLPFRIVCFSLLIVNLLLTYAVLRVITDSSELASLGSLVAAYHAFLADLYYSSGTIYDLLCYLFYYGSLLYYVRKRKQGRLGFRSLLVLAVLYVAALNAKEMAVSLPLLLLAYELLLVSAGSRSFQGAVLCGVMAICEFVPKFIGKDAMVANSAYAPVLGQFVPNLGHYLGMLFYVHRTLSGATLLAISAALVIVALAFRRKPHVALAVSIVMATPAAVLLIAPRSFYVFYIPMLGWALLAACLIWYSWPLRLVPHGGRELAALAVCFVVLAYLHTSRKPIGNLWVPAEQRIVRSILTGMDREFPVMPRSGRVLFLNDPFVVDDWILTMLLHLRYRDDTIHVHREKQSGPVAREKWGEYDYVVTLEDWNLTLIQRGAANPAGKR